MTFRKARTYNQMTQTQLRAFEKSYDAYVRYYNNQGVSFDSKMTRSEYFENYKIKYNQLKSQGKTTAAIPRQIAAEQKYERSYKQDIAAFKALHEQPNFKKEHRNLKFTQFRKLDTEHINSLVWEDIRVSRQGLLQSGMTSEEVSSFIGQYYFGSE